MDRTPEDQQLVGLQTLQEVPTMPQPNMVQINNVVPQQTDLDLIISEVIKGHAQTTSERTRRI